MELSVEQLLLIGFVVSVLTQGIKYLSIWLKFVPSKRMITIVAAVVSIALAFVWLKPVFGPIDDVWLLLQSVVGNASGILGLATLVYNVILDKLFKFFGLSEEQMIARVNPTIPM